MSAIHKITIQEKPFYLLEWDENHTYRKTRYYLRDSNWKFVSSLWESKIPDQLLFDINKALYGSIELSSGAFREIDRETYWKLSKPRKKAKNKREAQV